MTIGSLEHPTSRLRYRTDTGSKNALLDTRALNRQVRALFVQWVRGHGHERDFVEAVTHSATNLLGSYLIEGQPNLANEVLPEFAPEDLRPERIPTAEETASPRHRFFDENGHLEVAMRTERHHEALVPLFLHWVAHNWLAWDFIDAVRDAASSAVYDYTLSQSMGGLGGCKTAAEFLLNPFSAD